MKYLLITLLLSACASKPPQCDEIATEAQEKEFLDNVTHDTQQNEYSAERLEKELSRNRRVK